MKATVKRQFLPSSHFSPDSAFVGSQGNVAIKIFWSIFLNLLSLFHEEAEAIIQSTGVK